MRNIFLLLLLCIILLSSKNCYYKHCDKYSVSKEAIYCDTLTD